MTPFPEGSRLAALMNGPVRPGRVVWIGVRPERRAPMRVLELGRLCAGAGLEGDRYRRVGGARQLTLIGAESLAAIASHLGRAQVGPEALRRNLVVAGVNLLALKGRRARVGGAVVEIGAECHPCSFLETSLGPGGYNAARGHGGVVARILADGEVRPGDPVERLD